MVAPARVGRRIAEFLLALLLIAGAASTGWTAQVDPLPFAHDNSRLKLRIDEHWRVIPLQDGLLLVPKRPASLKGVELTRDGAIAIDGQTVTGADLQNRLGADADAVLRLSYLPAAERAALFLAQPPADTEPVERSRPDRDKGDPDKGGAASGNIGQRAGARSGAGSGASGNGPRTEVMPIARGDRFRFGGNARVDESEQVKSVTAILGAAFIDGIVTTDVVAVGGDVHLGPKAVVRGSVTAIGGAVRADPNARIDGQVNEVGLNSANLRVWWPHGGDAASFSVRPDWPRIGRITFISGLLMTAVWLALCAGALLIAPGAVNRTRVTMAASPLGSFATGLATQLLFAPLMALLVAVLAISVIGIPLIALIPVAIFALFVGTVFGFTAVLQSIGERLVGRAFPFFAMIMGGLLLSGVTLTGRYLWMTHGGTLGWPFALALLGLFLEYIAITLAIGGAVLSYVRNFKWRRNRALAAQTPAPLATESADSSLQL